MTSSRPPIWRKTGSWYGGTVFSLALTKKSILAATLAGIYRSNDAGLTWQFCAFGINDPAVNLLRSVANTDIVFAATQSGRLYRSNSAGEIWHEIETWAGYGVIEDLTLAPDFEKSTALFIATSNGIYRSFDGGVEWQSADFGLLETDILAIACAPDFAESEMLWAGGASGGLYRSRNGARAWRESGFGLTDMAVQCISPSPHFSNDKTVFIGLEGGGVFVSHNAGNDWHVCGLSDQVVHCLVWHKDDLFAGTGEGIFVSRDNGDKWSQLHDSQQAILSLCHSGKVILGGAWDLGIMRSDAKGKKWVPANNGLAAHLPPQAQQCRDGRIYMLATDTFAGTMDGGSSWKILSKWDPLDERGVQGGALSNLCIIQHEDEQGAILASSSRLEYFDFLSAFDANGMSNQPPVMPGEQRAISCITTAVGDPRHLLVSTVSKRVMVSHNAGKTWSSAPGPNDDGTPLQAEITHDGAYHIITYTAKLASKGDGGDEMGEKVVYDARIWRWEPSLDEPTTLPQSPDDWALLSTLIDLEVPLVSLVNSDQALLIGAQNSVISVISDAKGFQPHRYEFDELINITQLRRDPQYPKNRQLLAATNRGIFATSDDGRTWQIYSNELKNRSIVSLLTASGQLQAVTLGGEIWVCDGS
jgi:photosystem II stability/assembly factor-like uncharacterized protein